MELLVKERQTVDELDLEQTSVKDVLKDILFAYHWKRSRSSMKKLSLAPRHLGYPWNLYRVASDDGN